MPTSSGPVCDATRSGSTPPARLRTQLCATTGRSGVDLRFDALITPVTNRSFMARRSAARWPWLVDFGLAMVTLLAHCSGARVATIAELYPSEAGRFAQAARTLVSSSWATAAREWTHERGGGSFKYGRIE